MKNKHDSTVSGKIGIRQLDTCLSLEYRISMKIFKMQYSLECCYHDCNTFSLSNYIVSELWPNF
jgi:hypothetical protein